ncbi:deleted in malignant brain tumors 1 protein-like [Montipora foliosa]|uniref:deleted in malignant brain tumors 1 protein-like n=1 Tax=Montipora foliosa TaxID=591990 RepID=UPI0035F1D9E1
MFKAQIWLLCLIPCVMSLKDGDVRLFHPNSTAYEGRLEIFHNGKWGSVCDDWFGMEEADVVCRQLNFTQGAQYVYGNAHYGQSSGPIFLDDVHCVGNETALIDCKHNGWQGHDCHHYEDVGVVCLTNGKPSTPGNCDFEKGNGLCGYKRVFENFRYFNWTFKSRQIYSRPPTDHTTQSTTGDGFFLTTFMKFWEDISQGNIARLQSPIISSATCLEFYYVMSGTRVGDLVVYVKTGNESLVWQLFGDQGREWKKAVIPLKSEYKNFNIIFEGIAGTGYYGSDIAIDDISVLNAVNCTFSPPEARPVPVVTPNRTVRLVSMPGSSVKSGGRVEVFYNSRTGGRWGTICSGYRKPFDINAATVVCKELGYEGAEMVVRCCNVFEKGTGRIWMDNVECHGTEPSITMCSHSGWGNTYCSHNQDVAVVCRTKETDRSEFAVRLGGHTGVSYEGRVELNIGGLWGTITDRGWDIYDATVVCKQLQFGGAVGAYTGSAFGKGDGLIWMSDFECKGNEDSLAKCNHSNTKVQRTWDHYSDASVECFGLKLAGGRGSNMSGRVEVMYKGDWGTVCDSNWSIKEGNVVCRQFGFRRAEDVASFGKGSGPIFLDQVHCRGDEPSLSLCRNLGWTAHHCTHDNDAGVTCTNAICGKSQPCSNGGTCNSTSGLCNCAPFYFGELCEISVGNQSVKVVVDEKLDQWNATSFTSSLVKKLNSYCSKNNCFASPGAVQTTKQNFEASDVKIIQSPEASNEGVVVSFVVVYPNSENITVVPKKVLLGFFNSGIKQIAGYKVIKVDDESEISPGGQHSSQQRQQKSKSLAIYLGVFVPLAVVIVLVLGCVVQRYRKRLGRNGAVPRGRYSDHSFVALSSQDDDDTLDDTALLRPPQQTSDEGDLMS